ncbi:MAG: zinc ribbon domain-containing protein [Anaerolineales bacterium]|uniref:FmdB family zinc ribbon protein n=1 Tax=Promineifilum sp. TaxID=2664178 RepID=UPI001D7D449C|nr:zinc ribbon domain-containing protein [Anaerolineales bacterium]MCB8935100.1 zinc ribbon domain-containing protein [Promineifilum sp.]MCO5179169.1 zinc ribbon domain-containing protein [Promineifilum sp.]
MPFYEYKCLNCGRPARLHLSYAEYDHSSTVCPHCGQDSLQRRVGRVAVARSDDARVDSLMTDESLAGLEEDPRAMGRFMRAMSRETGEEMGGELKEVAERLEKGESMASIERSMPELGGASIDDEPL